MDEIDDDHQQGEEKLWELYRSRRSRHNKELLINFYQSFAEAIALRFFKNYVVSGVQYEDCIQYALSGLIEAVDKYDQQHATSFYTYSQYRIRGSILNGISQYNEKLAQMSVKKQNQQERLETVFQQQSDNDLFSEVLNNTLLLGINFMLENTDEMEQETEDESPYSNLDRYVVRRQLKNYLQKLPEKQKKVLEYHYYEDLSFAEIAELMELTRSRIHQLFYAGMDNMRCSFKASRQLDISF